MHSTDVARISLDRLRIDPSIQPRIDGLDEDHVRELAESPESWSELTAVDTGDGLALVDGFHRYEAARLNGLEAVHVRVIPAPSDLDLRSLAFSFNAEHGKALSRADRRYEAERLVRAYPQLADREIARRCGLAPNTVGALRDRLEDSGDVAATDARIGADGKSRPVASRSPGELPPTGIGEEFANVGDLILGKPERRKQRRIASYLQRLAIALDDQQRFPEWQDAKHAAEAVRAVLPEEQIGELAQRLGYGARRVIETAGLLKTGRKA